MQREIVFFEDYFNQFYLAQTQKVRDKIDFVLILVTTVRRIPEQHFKHLEGSDGLYEMRIQQGSNIYRIFCCFDEGNVVVLFNGFQKKTQKTPKSELELAEKIKKEYFNQKKANR